MSGLVTKIRCIGCGRVAVVLVDDLIAMLAEAPPRSPRLWPGAPDHAPLPIWWPCPCGWAQAMEVPMTAEGLRRLQAAPEVEK